MEMVQTNARLFTPTPRVAQRLMREVLQAEARENDIDYIAAENRFWRARSGLAHLCTHTPYKNKTEILSGELVNEARTFMQHAELPRLYSSVNLTRLQSAFRSVEAEVRKLMAQIEVTEVDIHAYLRVVEALREHYLRSRYDPTSVVNPEHYAQALLIAENFAAYDRALNER